MPGISRPPAHPQIYLRAIGKKRRRSSSEASVGQNPNKMQKSNGDQNNRHASNSSDTNVTDAESNLNQEKELLAGYLSGATMSPQDALSEQSQSLWGAMNSQKW